MTETDKLKKFLQSWLENLLDGINELSEENKTIIFSKTGEFCANYGSNRLFVTIREQHTDLNARITTLKEKLQGVNVEKISSSKIKVTYPRCYCHLVEKELINAPTICNCSVFWLKHNFQTLLEKDVNVNLKGSVLKGNDKCEFEIVF